MQKLICNLLPTMLLAFSSTAQAEKAPLPEAEFHLETYRKTIALRGEVNGTQGLFLFDTAGGITLLSPKYAEQIKCKPWGNLSGHRMMGDRLDSQRCDDISFKIAGTQLKLPVAAIVDVTSFLPKGAAPVEGSIALDLFAGRTITIDFPTKRLYVESPASFAARIKGATEVPTLLSREMQGRALAVNIGVPSAKGTVWMELDSGNGGSLLVAKSYAPLFGLDASKDGPQEADFPVAGRLRAKGLASTPNMILDGNLGMPFLRSKVVTFDLANGRTWISEPTPSQSEVK
jgi:hypothetical protein